MLRSMRSAPAVAVLSLMLGTACGKSSLSRPTEAPDSENTLDNFKIYKTYTYSELQQNSELQLPDVPWTDTYWPLVEQGMAARWVAPSQSGEEMKLGSFLSHYAEEAGKPLPDPTLSPAEKYDLVFQYRHGLTLPVQQLQALAAEMTRQDQLMAAKTDVAGKREVLRSAFDALMSSDNLPLNQAMSMTVNGWKPFFENSLASKNKFLGGGEGVDWAWEGHCHGWAPAATMTLPPAHGVMAVIGNQRVFFSEGDLRGLLTKAWADSAPDDSSYFLGRRCDEGDDANGPIPSNANGRGYSGRLKLTADAAEVPFTVIDTLPNMSPSTPGNDSRRMTFYRIRLEPTNEVKILVERPITNRRREYWVANSFSQISRGAKAGDPLQSLQKAVSATLTGCWDTNPASFHQLLVEQLGVRKVGFVMDRTRTSQVWNQPIYNASFDIKALQPVGSVADVAAKYRASGTAYLAEVHAVVGWSSEPPRPRLVYPDGFDLRQIADITFDYTLEFDAQMRVIGGEWGTFKDIKPAAEVPDFLFGYPANSKPLDAYNDNKTFDYASIDYSGIIGKLHECSLVDRVDGRVTFAGVRLPYSTCVIAKE